MKGSYIFLIALLLVSIPQVSAQSKGRTTKSQRKEQEHQKKIQELLLYASAYHAEGNLALARNHYEMALELEPNNPHIYQTLSYLYLAMGDAPAGIKLLDKAVARFPNDVDFLYHRAYFHIQMGNTDKALGDWTRVIQKDKNHVAARWSRGQYYLKQQNYVRAQEDFTALSQIDPDPSRISNFFLAKTLQSLGKHSEAVQQLKIYAEAILLNQESNYWHPIGEAYFFIAHNLRLAGQFDEAAVYYGKAIEAKLWPDITTSQRVEAQRYSNRSLAIPISQ
jgi:tetratricopeptide (TPR) repeat protein